MIKKILKRILIILILFVIFFFVLSFEDKPEEIKYGMSFNVPYAQELGLDWKQVYIESLDDLGIKRLRLAAHWPLIEPQKDKYNFEELDFEIKEAEKRGVEIILAIGRRLPRWPECHIPAWAIEMSDQEWQTEISEYLKIVINRYKDYKNIKYWQVENEPYLEVFAYEHCGGLDRKFLKEEISLVKQLDPSRPVLVTDSGNLGTWFGAYKNGDVFGTSVYLYFWNPELGKFKSRLPASFYRAKANLMQLLFGKKETFLIELSAEPWLTEPLNQASIEDQLERMNLEKIEDIIEYAKKTRLEKQYLWGVEWWYWMRENGYPEFWNWAREFYKN